MEWSNYKVGKLPTGRSFSDDCRQITTVSHVAHLDTAISIVLDGKIRQNPIFDRSKLNTSRVLVVWASPNHWTNGFRYGNVAFQFGFQALVVNKKYYWVEAMTGYTPTACRILVTSEDRSNTLTPYDPAAGDGPWWFDGKDHYYNSNYCLEFMFESELKLSDLDDFNFVKHHSSFCSRSRDVGNRCPERGKEAGPAGAKFFAMAAARRLDLSEIHPFFTEENGRISSAVDTALNCTLRPLSKMKDADFLGLLKKNADAKLAVARSLLNASAFSRGDEVRSLAGLYRSEDEALDFVATVLSETLGIEDEHSIRKKMT